MKKINEYRKLLNVEKTAELKDLKTIYRNAITSANQLTSEICRNMMLRYLVTSGTAHTTDGDLLKWMKNAIGNTNSILVKMIAQKQDLLQKLGKGKLAPYFDATDAAGNKFLTL